SLKVDDRPLAAAIGELGVVRLEDDIQHDRAWTEVERNEVAHMTTWVARNRPSEAALLDAAHADDRAGALASHHRRVRPEASIGDDRRQPIHMHDVIDL